MLFYLIPAKKVVSKSCISNRMKDISLRVFSKIICGLSEAQRRQLGAMTIARLLMSILVLETFTTWLKICKEKEKQ